MYKFLLRPLLFLLPPEAAHRLTFQIVKAAFRIPGLSPLVRARCHYESPHLAKHVFGINFPGPIGLAAGFDKDAKLIDPLAAFGFGFIEIGTVTPKSQIGNPKPRLFRLSQDDALINRMGFNNQGLQSVVNRLKKRKSKVVIGGNIGKNKDTPNESAFEDYVACFHALYPWVDYFVVNVSSPNTPGLRDLQEKAPLQELLSKLQTINQQQSHAKPILLKIAPDLTQGQLDDIINIVRSTKIAGLVATNTTVERTGLSTSESQVKQIGSGGLSGKPLTAKSTEVIRYLKEQSRGEIPIIGVGGIFNPADALEKLQAGASLVQVYTGFIYEGPLMVKRLNKALAQFSAKSS